MVRTSSNFYNNVYAITMCNHWQFWRNSHLKLINNGTSTLDKKLFVSAINAIFHKLILNIFFQIVCTLHNDVQVWNYCFEFGLLHNSCNLHRSFDIKPKYPFQMSTNKDAQMNIRCLHKNSANSLENFQYCFIHGHNLYFICFDWMVL